MTFVVSHLWLIYALACGAIWLYVGKRRRWALRLSDVSIGRSMPTLMPAGAWVVSAGRTMDVRQVCILQD